MNYNNRIQFKTLFPSYGGGLPIDVDCRISFFKGNHRNGHPDSWTEDEFEFEIFSVKYKNIDLTDCLSDSTIDFLYEKSKEFVENNFQQEKLDFSSQNYL